MKPVFYSLAAAVALALAAPALAQDASSGASSGAMAQPMSQGNSNMSSASVPSGNSNDKYWGVDTSGVREDVKAPYGGRNQAQADRKEAPITQDLNEQALKNAQPH